MIPLFSKLATLVSPLVEFAKSFYPSRDQKMKITIGDILAAKHGEKDHATHTNLADFLNARTGNRATKRSDSTDALGQEAPGREDT